MVAVRHSSLKRFEKSRKRRRTRLSTRIRFKRPTAKNQKRQLYSLSKRVARNTRYIRNQRVYTDYQWGDDVSRGIAMDCKNAKWYGWPLTDYTHWIPVLRRDANVAEAQRTFALRMQLNCRVSTGTVTKGAFLNIFLVSPRANQVEPLSLTPPPAGTIGQLSQDEDYIKNGFQGTQVRLNPSKYHVHACKYITLCSNTLDAALPATDPAGDPYSTWRKWSWTVPLKFSVRSTDSDPWHKVPFHQQYYNRKYFLLIYSTNGDGGDLGAFFTCDLMATCLNYD